MKCYLSGKITGDPDYIKKFAMYEAFYKKHGLRVVNPAKKGNDKAWDWYMRRDITLLMKCDAIIMLPDWQESKGAKLEKHIAEQLRMLFIYAADDKKA